MAVIQAEGIQKVYGTGDVQVHALRDCNLTISQGERLAVTGDSGAGKSTLLHILSGLDSPTGGQVLYDGKNIASMKEKELAVFRRRNIGFVFQAYNLVPELTAWENILLPPPSGRNPGGRGLCAGNMRLSGHTGPPDTHATRSFRRAAAKSGHRQGTVP